MPVCLFAHLPFLIFFSTCPRSLHLFPKLSQVIPNDSRDNNPFKQHGNKVDSPRTRRLLNEPYEADPEEENYEVAGGTGGSRHSQHH